MNTSYCSEIISASKDAISITSIEVLSYLMNTVNDQIPADATTENIWEYLGWGVDESAAYAAARQYGIDLRPLLAPAFADIVSIVVDGAFGFPFEPGEFNWTGILSGEVIYFTGDNPKERLLAVIECAVRAWMHA
jgi:hypothetical protein